MQATSSSFILQERQAQGMPQSKMCSALSCPAASAINFVFVVCSGIMCLSVCLASVVRSQDTGLRVKADVRQVKDIYWLLYSLQSLTSRVLWQLDSWFGVTSFFSNESSVMLQWMTMNHKYSTDSFLVVLINVPLWITMVVCSGSRLKYKVYMFCMKFCTVIHGPHRINNMLVIPCFSFINTIRFTFFFLYNTGWMIFYIQLEPGPLPGEQLRVKAVGVIMWICLLQDLLRVEG